MWFWSYHTFISIVCYFYLLTHISWWIQSFWSSNSTESKNVFYPIKVPLTHSETVSPPRHPITTEHRVCRKTRPQPRTGKITTSTPSACCRSHGIGTINATWGRGTKVIFFSKGNEFLLCSVICMQVLDFMPVLKLI